MFIALPVLTLKLSKSDYGMYDLILTGVSFLIPLVTLQMQSAAFRFLIECRENEARTKQIITNITLVMYTITSLVSVCLVFALQKYPLLLRLGIALYFFSDMMYVTTGQIVRGRGYNGKYSIAALILSCVKLSGIVMAVGILHKGLTGLIWTLVFANVLAVAYMNIHVALWNQVHLADASSKVILELLHYSFPMVFNNLAVWMLNLSNRMVLNYFWGLEATATYAVANKIPSMISFAQSIMVMAWQENASLSVTDEDAEEYFSKMFQYCFDILFVMTVLLLVLQPIIFSILIRGDYRDAYPNISILILGMFFYVMSSFLGGIYVAHKETKEVAGSALTAALLNLLLNVLFIGKFGVIAATVSTLCACAVLYAERAVRMKKIQKIKYQLKHQLQLIFILIVMVIVGQKMNALRLIINFILGFYVVWRKKSILTAAVHKVRNKGKMR